MDVRVRTGSTKAPRDVSLLSLQLESLQGEQVFVLLETAGREREATTVERECEAIIKHALLDAEGEATDRLDGTLKELNGLLKGMLVSGAVHDIHMLIGIMDKSGALHVSHAGRAEAYLIRRGTASQITEYTGGRSTPAFVHIASGQLERNDFVVLSTQRLLRALTPAQLSRLAQNRDTTLDALIRSLESEVEHAALATIDVGGVPGASPEARPTARTERQHNPIIDRRRRMQNGALRRGLAGASALTGLAERGMKLVGLGWSKLTPSSSSESGGKSPRRAQQGGKATLRALSGGWNAARAWFSGILADLHHPQRRKRAHLLLIASALALVVVVWASVHLLTSTQRSKTKAELEALVEQINADIQTAENRRIMGSTDEANAILQRAEQRAKDVMNNESGLFRVQANDLLSRIRSKHEEINNIMRVQQRPAIADLSAKNPDIIVQGMIGLGDNEFLVFDRQDLYRVIYSVIETPNRLSEDVLVVDGANFPRSQSYAFLTNGNSIIEWQNGQAVSMKTDDARGWINGTAVATNSKYLYVLSPENKQIYKYERLQNRFAAPVEYNVNGDLTGAIDMTIDYSIYVLKDNGTIVKLNRGEKQPFVIRKMPSDALKGATKIFKVEDRNFYVLVPNQNGRGGSVVVFSDGGETGESAYVKQYVFEGDLVGKLRDLYVDGDESNLYILDEKRIHVVNMTTR